MLQLIDSLPPSVVPIVRLFVWLAILAAIFVPLERLFAVRPKRIFRKETGTDLGYYFLNGLLPAMILSVPLGMLAWAAHRLVPVALLDAAAAMPLWARVLAALVAGDIGSYWGHRWSHEIPFLWRFHAIHHSAGEMDFLVSSRAHPLDMVFVRLCALVPIYVLGLSGPTGLEGSQVALISTLIGTFWGFFIHANLRWRFGPLEWLIATPAFHHWHHTLSGPIDKNYAANLPWLDWVFGSLYLPKSWPDAYGIKATVPETLTDQLLHPLFPPKAPVPANAGAEVPNVEPVA